METELAIALSSMRAERGYVCENCARCPAGGMCQFFLFPSLLPASHFHLPCLSGQPQHYGCCLPAPRLKQPLYLLATRCHPSVPPSTLAAESTNHQSRDKLPRTQQCPRQPSVIDTQRRTAQPPSHHHRQGPEYRDPNTTGFSHSWLSCPPTRKSNQPPTLAIIVAPWMGPLPHARPCLKASHTSSYPTSP